MPIERADQIGGRLGLAELCNVVGLTRAVEVGTDRGVFAADFLRKWRGEIFYAVDAYRPYPNMPYSRDADFLAAVQALQPYHARVRFLRMESREAAVLLQPPHYFPPQFVYIDGDHDYTQVAQDITLWWAALAEHGILAGHDYHESHQPGVWRAVNEFAINHPDAIVYLVGDYNQPDSWYVHK